MYVEKTRVPQKPGFYFYRTIAKADWVVQRELFIVCKQYRLATAKKKAQLK